MLAELWCCQEMILNELIKCFGGNVATTSIYIFFDNAF